MILKNVKKFILDPVSIESTDIRIDKGKISDVGKNLIPRRNEDVHNLSGKIVMPGLVCGHTHLYSSLSRGMPSPSHHPENFLEVLQYVWWKLDRALDEESIYYSAMVGAIEAALSGTTTLVDHHASPNSIAGSLDIIKEALTEIGLRGVLCYEVTDRGGKKERDAGLKENERFIRLNNSDAQFRGIVGAHAAFTMSNESLRRCSELAAHYRTGIHIHAAEGKCDIANAEEDYCCSLADRLIQEGVAKEKSILAHCIHFSKKDFEQLRKSNCWMVHHPRSNMNNTVGYAPIHEFGTRAAMGTDGFRADMFEEARFGFFKHQESGNPLYPVDMTALLSGNQKMISEIFRRDFTALSKGSVADLVVIDYESPTPMTADNLRGHFLFGMQSSMVESVMCNGKWIVKDRELLGVDTASIFEKASKSAKKLWNRMQKI